jgi:nucleotide-binding universal stress UspA family protein
MAQSPPESRAANVVIVGIDGGAGSAHVLRAGARLAELSGAQMVVAHVVAMTQLTNQVALAASYSLVDIEADLFPDVVEGLIEAVVPWTLVTLTGNPARALAQLSRERCASAIVVGADTPGWTSRLRRLSAGSVPNKLAHSQRAPVVIVPEACAKVRQRVDQAGAGSFF